MNEKILKAFIETIPAEVTIIDANDEVIGWNRHENRVFKRPLTSMGLNFRQCHPESSLSIVEQIINEMKAGTRDKVRFWIDLPVNSGSGGNGEMPNSDGSLPTHKMLIEFYALRDDAGNYIGCMEYIQDIEEIRKLEGIKRLIDG